MPAFNTDVLAQISVDRLQYPPPAFTSPEKEEVVSLEEQMLAEVQGLENDQKVLRSCMKKSAVSSVPASALPISMGAEYICPVAALALLEIIALRRNLVSQQRNIEEALLHAANVWESRDELCRFDHIEHFHTRWAAKEQFGHVPRISS